MGSCASIKEEQPDGSKPDPSLAEKAENEARKNADNDTKIEEIDEDQTVEESTIQEEEEEIYADTEEEREKIRARLAKFKQKKEEKLRSRELSRRRKREAAGDERAIHLLKRQLSDIVCMRQMTTEYQKGRFGVEDYNKNSFYKPNRMFDYDRVKVKATEISRENDLKKPEPVIARVTFDWTNSVQKSLGTAYETYECIWLGEQWKIRSRD